jgi:hypothetical protein
MREASACHLNKLRAAWPFLVFARPVRSLVAAPLQKLRDSPSQRSQFLIAIVRPQARILDISHGRAFAGGYG